MADKWILQELAMTRKTVDESIRNFEFAAAADSLHDFTWNKLADWYLEVAKIEKEKSSILIYILKNVLIMWHPFIPYVTETLWESFNDDILMMKQWPAVAEATGGDSFAVIQEAITGIRNARSENKIEPARKVKAVVVGPNADLLVEQAALLCGLRTGVEAVESAQSAPNEAAIRVVLGETEIYLLGAVDPEKEKARLSKEKENLEKLIAGLSIRLENQEFVSRAPAHILKAEQDKLARYQSELANINDALKA
ncbi:hypothetical protein CVU83_01840 [Candidatus Falkowbacteria bacterium HGW-Falkowbacteria-2]|uniref:valine--tRNA ligase n=1 Tax=Candidatus Falkowbacteria bacterium HGW-Falkowbacteria-2 TaxID=2013769 RepID=A0A2N2E0Y2_9BACT|nr:MAG: hypothetical protein CVU83_01840 [Candidatus Falkowbacteria bacterium HGW-Falkowbacteria-2]